MRQPTSTTIANSRRPNLGFVLWDTVVAMAAMLARGRDRAGDDGGNTKGYFQTRFRQMRSLSIIVPAFNEELTT